MSNQSEILEYVQTSKTPSQAQPIQMIPELESDIDNEFFVCNYANDLIESSNSIEEINNEFIAATPNVLINNRKTKVNDEDENPQAKYSSDNKNYNSSNSSNCSSSFYNEYVNENSNMNFTEDSSSQDGGTNKNSKNMKSSMKKKFICEYDGCSRSYTTAGNLKTHTKIHKGIFYSKLIKLR
jgi:hypothetical protein